MEAGVHSHHGLVVQLLAEEEYRQEVEPVLTRLLEMAEATALALLRKVGLATPTIVLFMEAGLHSHHGQVVQLTAEEEHKPGQELVLTQLLNMVDIFALDLLKRAIIVTLTNVLFMEAGLHSHLGQAVQLIVEEEFKPGQELALIHLLDMVEIFALDLLKRGRIVILMTVQVITDINKAIRSNKLGVSKM